MRTFVSLGFGLAALAVVAGAFGAHWLGSRLSAEALALWETAARYLMYGALALALVGLAARSAAASPFAGWFLLAGTLVFSGTVGALALGGPRWLGAVTPVGGLLMIIGLVLAAVTALR